MIHPLQIPKYINKIIFDDPDINQIIDDRIYQLVASNGTNKPFIVSSRGTINSTQTKDKRIDNTVMFTFDIYSDNYYEQVDIQMLIDKQVSGTHQTPTGEYFYCIVSDFNEQWVGDCYNQQITFQVRLT